MTQSSQKDSVFIKEVANQQKRRAKIIELTHSTTKAAGVMLLGAIVAIIIANSAYYAGFTEFWETDLLIGFGLLKLSTIFSWLFSFYSLA